MATSTLRRGGPDDDFLLQWTKLKSRVTLQEIDDICRHSMSTYHPSPSSPAPLSLEDTLTVIPFGDQHWGQLCWAPEVGENWDLDISAHSLTHATRSLISRAPPSDHCVLLWLGDIMHANDRTFETPRGKHKLDVDGRWVKAYDYTCQYIVDTVMHSLEHFNTVAVRLLPGNHDPEAALVLARHAAARFHGEKRVKIDTNPSIFWHMRFGQVMLAATHGHETKLTAMPSVMSAYWPKAWGATTYRYGFLGHLHARRLMAQEGGGAVCEIVSVPMPPDAYAYNNGWSSLRQMQAVTYDRTRGEIGRITEPLGDCRVARRPRKK